MGPKPKLRAFDIDTLPCRELDIIASFEVLERLTLSKMEELRSLPQGLSDLRSLTNVHLKDVKKLHDISVLQGCKSLVDFRCTGYGPERKSIAKVNASIAGRTENRIELKTTYASFMKSMYKTMSGKEDPSNAYSFPLWFNTPENLLNWILDFPWVEEHIYGKDGEIKDIFSNPEHGLKPLAILEWEYPGCNREDYTDSNSQEFFLVDTESPLNPVFLFGHGMIKPTETYKTFDAFLDNLRDFVLESDDGVRDED